MTWDRAAPEKITEARLLIADPETVYRELQEYGTYVNGPGLVFGDEELENTLFQRNDRLVNLGLAQYGTSAKILKQLYHSAGIDIQNPSDAKYNMGLRVSCLSNKQLGWMNGFDYAGLFSKGECAETIGLLKNPSIDVNVLCSLYRKNKTFEHTSDKTWFDFVNYSSNNPRLNIDKSSSYGPDDEHYNIHKSIFSLLENAPATSYALQTLYILLNHLEPDKVKWPDAIDHVLERWNAVDVTDYKGGIRGGHETHLSFKDEFRCLIGSLYGRRLTKTKPPGSEVMGSPDDQDVAKRCVYYGNAEMTPLEMESGYSKDYATFIFSVLRNDNVLLNPKTRAFLEDHLSEDFAWTYKERCAQMHKKRSWFDPRPVSEQGQPVIEDMFPQKPDDVILLEKPSGNAKPPKISGTLFEEVKIRFQIALICLGMPALMVASAIANAFLLTHFPQPIFPTRADLLMHKRRPA